MNPGCHFQTCPVLPVALLGTKLRHGNMKMLFFSPDHTEVQQLGREFLNAGIPCEIHDADRAKIESACREAELWIRNDQDCHRALMLCVQLNMGFARRPISPIDELDFESEPAVC